MAARAGLDPDARFVGGYVDWEWRHARHAFDGLVEPVRGREVLELGCNLGATAIVLAALGAEVTAVDPSADFLALARANAERYELGARIAFLHVPDTRCLPLETRSFDWISCNSVLEYVAPEAVAGVLAEIDRVLRPGGIVAILGTSNRLWPREDHSRRWLVNYVPRRLDRLWGPQQRGISPWTIRRVLRDYDDLTAMDGARLLVALKARMGASRAKLAAAAALGRLGLPVGSLGPTISMLLRKR
jgi:SAM-dependent methyltransferase